MKLVLKPSITLIRSIVIASSLFATAAQAEVSSISSDNLVQYGKEQAFWVADVSCSDGSQRTIQRKTDGNEWCGKDVEGFCDSTKEGTATKICGAQYTSALALLETAKQAQNEAVQAEERARRAERERAEQRRLADKRIQEQRAERERQAAAAAAAAAAAEPLKKQISIEEELLKIEQEKLDLRRQELELQRRAVEIQSLLDEST